MCGRNLKQKASPVVGASLTRRYSKNFQKSHSKGVQKMKITLGLAAAVAGLIIASSGVGSGKIYLVGGESPSEGNGASPNNQPVGRGGDGPSYGNVGEGGRSTLRERGQYPRPPQGVPNQYK
jgi:hypothetical protein